jgi:hypothetical protein
MTTLQTTGGSRIRAIVAEAIKLATRALCGDTRQPG